MHSGTAFLALCVGGLLGAMATKYMLGSSCTSIAHEATNDKIVLNFAEVRAFQNHLRLRDVANGRKEWAIKKYQMDEPAGRGHYALLGYLSSLQKQSVIVDIGTRWGDSARALASEPSNFVYSFDIMNAADRIAKANSVDVKGLEEQLGNIQFFQSTNILRSKRGLAILRVAKIVLLDTLHQPDANAFEYDFVNLLLKNGFKGLLICDDIHLNAQMEKWWNSISLKKYDLTEVGHSSGTGLVDFSANRVQIQVA